MFNFFQKYRNSIAYTLFKKVYITFFILVSTFISYQIFIEYKNSKKDNIESFSKIENVYKNLYEKHIISKNTYEIEELTKAIFETTKVSGIIIEDKENKIIYIRGDIPFTFSSKEITKNNFQDLNFLKSEFLSKKIEFKGFGETYASVSLFIKNSEIFESIKETVFLMLFNLLGSMIILFILFTAFILKYLNKPLTKIIEETKKFDVVAHEVIEIKTDNFQKNEFYKLAKTFNKMSKEINEAYINMQQLTMIREIQKNKLEEQKDELIKANKSKDDFLANMSHELKTPLNSINVISEVMVKNRKKNLNEKQIKNLEIVNKCGRDLLFLVNDVLDLSKLEAGQIVLNNKEINVKDFVSSIYDMFKPQTKLKDVKFVVKVDENINSIYSDEERIKQIVKNLLSNALKFTEKGEISLEVEDDKDNVKIIVKDEGIGIPKDKLEHIFDRFKQVDGSTTRKYGGTGLGLSICKELAILLKGEISVESILDEGSVFEILIPKNEHLINSLKKEDKYDDKKKEETKETLFVYNNNPVSFFQIILLLNKNFLVKQYSKIDELISNYKDESKKVVIDISELDENSFENIKKEIKDSDLIVLYENEKVFIKNNEYISFQKPIDETIFTKI